MTSTKTTKVQPLQPKGLIAPYRELVAQLATKHGWLFTQVTNRTDSFAKGNAELLVTYGTDQVTEAVLLVGGKPATRAQGHGKAGDAAVKGKGSKLQTIWLWVTGDKSIKDTTKFVGRAETKALLATDLKAAFAARYVQRAEEAPKAEAPKASKPAPKAEAPKAPAGPTQAQRQATKDQAHVEEM